MALAGPGWPWMTLHPSINPSDPSLAVTQQPIFSLRLQWMPQPSRMCRRTDVEAKAVAFLETTGRETDGKVQAFHLVLGHPCLARVSPCLTTQPWVTHRSMTGLCLCLCARVCVLCVCVWISVPVWLPDTYIRTVCVCEICSLWIEYVIRHTVNEGNMLASIRS